MKIEGLFEKELKKRNVPYTKTQDRLYDIKTSDGLKNISIHNLELNYLRDKDPEIIEKFVEIYYNQFLGNILGTN